LLSDTGCSDYEQKYELFTRNEIGTGAKYFRDYTLQDNIASDSFPEASAQKARPTYTDAQAHGRGLADGMRLAPSTKAGHNNGKLVPFQTDFSWK
jgi:hypothetical protein